jgi:hypothetical protein
LTFFEKLDEYAEEYQNSSQHSDITLEQLKSLKIHKLNVLTSYLRSIKNTFQLYARNDFTYFDEKITQVKKSEGTRGRLIDKDDINEKQIQNNLIHRYEKNNLEAIFQFKQRLSQTKKQDIDSYKLPMGPFVVVSAFAKSIRLLHLSFEVKTTLYQLFETHVLKKLDEVYQDLNKCLKISKLETNPVEKIIENTSDKLTKISKDSLIKALTVVQNNLSLKTPLDVKNTLFKQLKKNKALETQQMDQVDNDSINLITMMFQQIQNDRNIPKTIQGQLAKLQVSYLKAAIVDVSLLEDNKHAAKLLLSALSQAAIGWSEADDKDSEFINELKSLVHHINNETNLNSHFFQTQLESFKQFLDSHKNNFKNEQTRINEKSHGRSKIMTAMKTVDALLSHKMEGRMTPPFIRNILLGPWKNLLVLLLVRHSNSSNHYLSMINFIDDLFALLNPEDYEFILKSNTRKVAKTYEEGLKLIAYPEAEISKKSKELQEFLIKNHQKAQIKRQETPYNPAQISDEVVTKRHLKVSHLSNQQAQPRSKKSSTNKNYYDGLNPTDKKLVKSIEYGMWLDFVHKNGKKIRAQLSWINPKTGKFLFVNERGLKITDKTSQQLADDLRNKAITIVEGT